MILNAFFIFSSTQLFVLRPFTMMKKKKIKTRLKLLQNKIPNAPIRVGLSPDNLISEICACCQVIIVPRSHRLQSAYGTVRPYRTMVFRCSMCHPVQLCSVRTCSSISAPFTSEYTLNHEFKRVGALKSVSYFVVRWFGEGHEVCVFRRLETAEMLCITAERHYK